MTIAHDDHKWEVWLFRDMRHDTTKYRDRYVDH